MFQRLWGFAASTSPFCGLVCGDGDGVICLIAIAMDRGELRPPSCRFDVWEPFNVDDVVVVVVYPRLRIPHILRAICNTQLLHSSRLMITLTPTHIFPKSAFPKSRSNNTVPNRVHDREQTSDAQDCADEEGCESFFVRAGGE